MNQPTTFQEPNAGKPRVAYVGCYTSQERRGHGTGITVFEIDAVSFDWKEVQQLEIVNPSFLAFDRRRRYLYSAHGDECFLTAFSIDDGTGRLTKLNQQPTGGKNTVHLSADPSNRFLVTANYGSGKLAVFPIREDGSLAAFTDQVALPGEPGPDKHEQAFSHPHHIPFDRSGRFIVVPDKGLDKVFLYRLDTSAGKLIANGAVAAHPGVAPRHVDFHPSEPFAYVVNELDSSVTTYRFDLGSGTLTPLQVTSTLPATFTGKSKGAEIVVAPSGDFLYVSNRGHESIAIFAVDRGSGHLTPVGWEPSQGMTPRFITLTPGGECLCVANQNSDTIVMFRTGRDGTLTATGQVIKTGSPACILFR